MHKEGCVRFAQTNISAGIGPNGRVVVEKTGVDIVGDDEKSPDDL